MMNARPGPQGSDNFPPWVPDAVRNYLVHTEAGMSIRALARASDCHPSTVLRQVRKLEIRRDDLLIDGALKSLSARASRGDQKDTGPMTPDSRQPDAGTASALTQQRIDEEARRILRRLCEQGAVLAAARDMDTAVVVRESQSGDPLRTTSVDREIAQAMALKDWIACADPDARIARYFITNLGRAALRRLTAQDENRAGGFTDKRTSRDGDAGWDMMALDHCDRPAARYHTTESPLVGLARRRDRDGGMFLSRDLVATGERLREDFELAQLATGGRRGWHKAATGQIPAIRTDAPVSARAAHERVRAALQDLGPGLGDVVLRCCCLLEGLEQTEKTMGWSARSGKIVLRIALERLARHYTQAHGSFGPLIG